MINVYLSTVFKETGVNVVAARTAGLFSLVLKSISPGTWFSRAGDTGFTKRTCNVSLSLETPEPETVVRHT